MRKQKEELSFYFVTDALQLWGLRHLGGMFADHRVFEGHDPVFLLEIDIGPKRGLGNEPGVYGIPISQLVQIVADWNDLASEIPPTTNHDTFMSLLQARYIDAQFVALAFFIWVSCLACPLFL